VRKISHRFQQIAKQLDIAVFEAAQLNRRVEQREEKRPRLSDLRASGGIEQDAHYVFLLYRPHYYGLSEEEGEAQIIVAKQRMGQTGTCDVSWIPERMRFEDFHPEPQSFGN
jgi:replicative DNA helicase